MPAMLQPFGRLGRLSFKHLLEIWCRDHWCRGGDALADLDRAYSDVACSLIVISEVAALVVRKCADSSSKF